MNKRKVLYFADIPAVLNATIYHRLGVNGDCEASLFIDTSNYRERMILNEVLALKGNVFTDIFLDSLMCPGIYSCKSAKDVESIIISYFDKLFKDAYDISEYSEIIILNDTYDAHFSIFFNIKHIQYTWVQSSLNNECYPGDYVYAPLREVIQKYNSTTPFAQCCSNRYILEQSTLTITKLSNLKYLTWDKQIAESNIDAISWKHLFTAFHLKKTIFNGSNKSLVIRNSNGSLFNTIPISIKNKTNLIYEDMAEIGAFIDSLSMSIFFDKNSIIFLKSHIHDPLPDETLLKYYPASAKHMPIGTLEIQSHFFKSNNIKFNTIIGYYSSSLDLIKGCSSTIVSLGNEFIKRSWHISSLLYLLYILYNAKIRSVFVPWDMIQVLKNICHKFNYPLEINEYKNNETYSKNEVIIVDCEQKLNINGNPTVLIVGVDIMELPQTPRNISKVITIRKISGKYTHTYVKRAEHIGIISENPNIIKIINRCQFNYYYSFADLEVKSEIDEVLLAIWSNQNKIYYTQNHLSEDYVKLNRQMNLLCGTLGSDHINKTLRKTTGFSTYLELLHLFKNKLIIALCVKDTPGNKLTDSEINLIKQLGFSKFNNKLWTTYTGLLIMGTTKVDVSENNECPISSKYVHNSHTIELASLPWRKGDNSKIVVDSIEYSVNKRGINIAIFDDSCSLIDTINYDAHMVNTGQIVRNM